MANMNAENQPTHRQQLYEEVWAEPVSVVAKRYGLSDVGLAKICRKLSIPLPSIGYWAKVKAGKIMKKVPLPQVGAPTKGMSSPAQFTDSAPQSPPLPVAILKPISAEKQKNIAETKQIARSARKSAQSISVSSELTDPHPLVAAAMKRLRKRDGWDDEKGLRSAPNEVLDIEVTESSLERSLLLMDNLIKKLHALSVNVRIIPASKQTVLDVNGASVPIKISEHVSRTNHEETSAEKKAREKYWNRSRYDTPVSYPSIPRFDYHPTGKLTIRAGRWPGRNWNDTNRTSLDDRLDEVVADIFVLAAAIKEKEDEEKRRKERRRLAEEQYAFLKNRLEDQQNKFKEIDEDAINWERAIRIRSFVDAKERKATMDGELPPDLSEWLKWARAKADWIDPLIPVSDPVLDAPEPKRPGYGYYD